MTTHHLAKSESGALSLLRHAQLDLRFSGSVLVFLWGFFDFFTTAVSCGCNTVASFCKWRNRQS